MKKIGLRRLMDKIFVKYPFFMLKLYEELEFGNCDYICLNRIISLCNNLKLKHNMSVISDTDSLLTENDVITNDTLEIMYINDIRHMCKSVILMRGFNAIIDYANKKCMTDAPKAIIYMDVLKRMGCETDGKTLGNLKFLL